MKFGKHIQKRQLDIPEYAANFVDYKALKKLIKKLSATPVIAPQGEGSHGHDALDPQTSLQANKATFFFRVERELEKVNTFYLQKEAELRLRLTTLLDKKRVMQQHPHSVSKTSSRYIALEEGLKQFSMDLNKLEQFVEVNETAFSKILKKWDKTSKSREKQLYLSRAVEVQPCFNREVISTLSDQATQALLDFSGWAEGEGVQAPHPTAEPRVSEPAFEAKLELDNQFVQAINTANRGKIEECLVRLSTLPDARDHVSRAFLSTVAEAPEAALKILLDSNLVNLRQEDEINERNCLHKSAISGRIEVLRLGISSNVDVHATDVYGRIPLHYACMHGHVELVPELINAAPDTVNFRDQDSFTPLILAIVHSQLACVETLLSRGADLSRLGPGEHVPLNLACQYASLEIQELLLQRSAEMISDAEGLFPQHLVARSGKTPQSLLLLQKYGANLDQPDKLYQWTPLFHAASEGHVECLQTLLQCGVDVDIVDEKSLSAMYYATWEGHLECMQLLASVGRGVGLITQKQVSPQIVSQTISSSISTSMDVDGDIDGIPEFILPPPIIPFRRYGHNFLDTKTFVVISFERLGKEAIRFYDESKYPAARLTISSKSSDLIPRNILLPIQDEFKVISFQIENIDTFSIDFDVYPTIGSRVIARSVASSKVFTERSKSTGRWHLELFDPRLRAIGRVTFDFQVVKPFHGIPLEITHFATYWKATSQLDSQPHTLITGSSLSGEYVRLFVQLTADGVPVLHPRWKIDYQGLEVPVNILTYAQFSAIGAHQNAASASQLAAGLTNATSNEIPAIYQTMASSFITLKDALALLPAHIHIELHVLFPSRLEEERLKLGPTHDMNTFADKILSVVFEHARVLRAQGAGEIDATLRSVLFSSFNQDICTVINWKQPNYPVLLCNELGADSSQSPSGNTHIVQSSGRTTISVKEAVQIAKNNNFMGLICSSRLLDLAPALIESIKTAGLVLVTDISDSRAENESRTSLHVANPRRKTTPDGVDGYLRGDGVLCFNETVDM
ncbi:ankyrin [Cucurbitaria berberidis CBS 394.84]|uniref:Ankyrin n=1 Tax=Cucurbitaria berberidis CBS 394.84 TaxID=1168544 RepID=A0A9P4LDD9_9PLEO|nr:ankyrin [Cucurbitaria berberidis CBS 394.84]KAF1850009.1 ankyrin [Cucurbitaria berberidis CBS 394.84]